MTPAISFSYGAGEPDHLTGYRLALSSPWPSIWAAKAPINIRGSWELSLSRWQVNPDRKDQPNALYTFAASPIIRLETRDKCFLAGQPYVELGIGVSFLSNNHLGHRNLGGQFAFQDIIGLGLHWKTTRSWSLSYHYLHYSNAGLFPPNQGIDVKHLISFTYEFA